MPVVSHEKYCEMLDNAKKNKFAYPAINVTSEATANACLEAFAETKSDGIIQVSTGGGEFASGIMVKDAALGAISIAQHIHLVADRYDINVALHTDHCQANKVESFLQPLLAASNFPIRLLWAPVKAPFSCPNNSLSMSDSESAAQLTRMYSLLDRGLDWWISRATTSFPVPLSPRISTGALLFATRAAVLRTSSISPL